MWAEKGIYHVIQRRFSNWLSKKSIFKSENEEWSGTQSQVFEGGGGGINKELLLRKSVNIFEIQAVSMGIGARIDATGTGRL